MVRSVVALLLAVTACTPAPAPRPPGAGVPASAPAEPASAETPPAASAAPAPVASAAPVDVANEAPSADCAPPPADARAITLERDPAHPERIADASLAAFPVESEDGRELAFLVTSQHDFIGGEVQTLRVFDAGGRPRTSFELFDARLDADAREERQVRLAEEKAFARASAYLATKRWRPMERAVALGTCSSAPWKTLDDTRDALSTRPLRFAGANVDVELAMPDGYATGEVTVRTLRGGAIDRRTVHAALSRVGTTLGPPSGGCGQIVGLDDGYITHDHGLVAALPTAMLGGDMCKGELEVDRLFFVHIPAR